MQQNFTINATQEDIEWLADSLLSLLLDSKQEEEDVILSLDLELLASSVAGITNPIDQLKDWLAEQFTGFVSWITDTVTTLLNTVIVPAIDAVGGVVDSLFSWAQTAFESVFATLESIGATLENVVVTPILEALAWVEEVFPQVVDAIRGAFEDISSFLSGIFDTVSGAVSGIIDAIHGVGDFISNLIGTIEDFLSSLPDLFQNIFARIEGFASSVLETLAGIPEAISNVVETVVSSLEGIASRVGDALSGIVKKVKESVEGIAGIVGRVADSLINFFKPFAFLPHVIEWLETVDPKLAEEWRSLLEVCQTPIDWIKNFPYTTLLTIKTIGVFVWQFMPESIRKWFLEVTNALKGVGACLTGFVNAILKFPEWFPVWFKEHISSPIAEAIEKVGRVFEPLGDITDILKKWTEELKGGVVSLAERTYEGFKDIGSFVIKKVKDSFSWIGGALLGVYEGISGIILSFVQKIVESFKGVAEKTAKAVSGLVSSAMERITKSVEISMKESTEIFVKAFGQTGYVEVVYPSFFKESVKGLGLLGATFSGIVGAQLAFRFIAYQMRAIAMMANHVLPEIDIDLRPLGIGFHTRFHLGKALGSTLWNFSETMEDWGNELLRGITYGGAIWVTRPLMRVYSASFRNLLPVTMPTMEVMTEALRRRLPTKAIHDMLDIMSYYMALYGYSNTVLDWYFKIPKKALLKELQEESAYIIVKDRFDKERIFPTSLLFALPTPSELVRMMIRDVIIEPRYFNRVMAMQGYTRDTSLMYYLLHFRYPSTERLWNFYTRAVAGVLWYSPPSESENPELWKDVKNLIKTYGIGDEYLPKAPASLNVTSPDIHNKHLYALTMYFKWHDYAPFSWIPNYTSDRFMMFDLMADIPTKIDMRWMTRWGLIQQIGQYVRDISTFRFDQVVNILKKATGRELFSEAPSGKIEFDVRLFAKLLQATGLHPHWIPIVSVAESINALADERTLLRTGVMNMYKEGLITIDHAEQIMSGLFVAHYKTAHFDTKKGKWEEFTWKVPVAWLPAERTLLEMRSIFDRVLDIYREFYRTVLHGIRVIVIKPEEGKELIKKFVEKVLAFASAELKKVTGQETKLAIDEKYLELWIDYASVIREIEAKERVRMWMYRLVAWLFYRISYGWVEEKDVDTVINTLKNVAFLSDYEASAIKAIMLQVAGIVGRQYIPTPSQLATICEYVPDAIALFEKVMKANRVPEEWWGVWRSYITARALKSDAKSLLLTYIRAYKYHAISKDELEAFIEEIKKYGFSEKEIEFFKKRIELEESIEELKEGRRIYIPTPTMLASIAEIVPEAREKLEEVLRVRGVPEEWKEIWIKYVALKPVVDELRRYLTALFNLYEYFAITEDALKKALEGLSDWGYEEQEIALIMQRLTCERELRAYRELIGTPRNLVYMAEYSPKARQLALSQVYKMIDALPVDEDTKNFIKAMWEEFIRVRPVYDEVRRYVTELINCYAQGILSDDELDEELNSLKEWGLDDYEIQFYKWLAEKRRIRKLYTS